MLLAVGKGKELESLRVLGVRVILLDEESDVRKVLEEILRSRAVVIEEDLYREMRSKLRRALEGVKYPPLVVVVPSPGREGTERLKDLYNLLSMAVGVKLKVGARGKSTG